MEHKMTWLFCVILMYSLYTTAEPVGTQAAAGGGTLRRGLLLAPRTSHYNTRLSDGFIIRDDDIIELTKKQFDDYGHMRFGKREDQFDDYGHLRFGRSDTD